MIFHDQQRNFHNYLIHGLQPPLLAASSPRWHKCRMHPQQHACRPCMHLEIIKA